MQMKDMITYKSVWLLIPLFVIIYFCIVRWVPAFFVQCVVSFYQGNSTTAQMHIDIANDISIGLLTLGYVILTYIIVIQTKRGEQIRFLERRLEKFYLPMLEIINGYKIIGFTSLNLIFIGHDVPLDKAGTTTIRRKGFDEVSNYRYLAEEETISKFEYILNNQEKLIKNEELLKAEIINLQSLLEEDRKRYMKIIQGLKFS
jgi:hypothetical protein